MNRYTGEHEQGTICELDGECLAAKYGPPSDH